jgi:hypothetical protein
MKVNVDPRIVQVAIAELPGIVAMVRSAFAKQNPDAPVPTGAEVMAAFDAAYTSSIAVDDNWLNANPVAPVDDTPPPLSGS